LSNEQPIKLDKWYQAQPLEHGKGWRIEAIDDPTNTPKLLSGVTFSLQEAREKLDKYKRMQLYKRNNRRSQPK
jgi:hypothetical protein